MTAAENVPTTRPGGTSSDFGGTTAAVPSSPAGESSGRREVDVTSPLVRHGMSRRFRAVGFKHADENPDHDGFDLMRGPQRIAAFCSCSLSDTEDVTR